jgi:pimeloyl-ACP methyl ester carboxylesterase
MQYAALLYNRRMSQLAKCACLAASLVFCTALHAQSAITTDPAPDKANPAAIDSFQLPSQGARLNALVYIAAGSGPHPIVILLHGFPGNERNLDLAQSIRRAGWDVLFFDYRGSWGSLGDFSFTHSIEDTQAAIVYLRDPANAKRFRSDPGNIVLIGHSMGGFLARYVGAHDPAIRAVALISAADMAVDTVESIPLAHRAMAATSIAAHFAASGMAPLAGCTPQSLANEVIANADAWNVPNLAPALASRPVLVITSDDGLAPSNDAFTAAIHKAGGKQITTLHLPTDHSYSDHRIALQTAVLAFLATLPPR